MKTLLLVGTLLISPALLAWQTMDCPGSPSYRIGYPGGSVWPLTFFRNMPSGSWSHDQVEAAMAQWNAIYGANDNMSIAGGGYTYCRQSDNAGIGVVGWDDGACYSWDSTDEAVTSFMLDGCYITHASIYFNADRSWSDDSLRYAALHELGHYQIDAHDWDEVTIMGYSDGDAMTFLGTPAHHFLRSVWPSGNTTQPDLYIHRFVLRDHVIPGVASITMSPVPECYPGPCHALEQGDRISVKLTYGNAGSRAVYGQLSFRMYLSNTQIGSWSVNNYPAHAQDTFEFVGEVPPGIAPGTYQLQVWIDPEDDISESSGPTPANSVHFDGFTIHLPASWFCPPSHYGTLDGCDCECGAYDPDCDYDFADANGCDDGEVCTDDRCDLSGHCYYPANSDPCDDGLFCSHNDRCQMGSCVAGVDRDCSAESSFCSAGVCDEDQDLCRRDPLNEDQACSDHLYCTVEERCSGGFCLGQDRDCTSLDTQCAQGRCSEVMDSCLAEPANQGEACDDGSLCSNNDQCDNGTCQGLELDCSDLDTACQVGVCEAAGGTCVLEDREDATPCQDGDFCTVQDSCQGGVCLAGSGRDCTELDSQCSQGQCDEANDTCIASPTNETEPCSDQLFCTSNDRCRQGQCLGQAVDCSELTSQCTLGVCTEQAQGCVAQDANQGNSCDDGQYCTVDDTCQSGECTGQPRTCPAVAVCHSSVCNEETDLCESRVQADGNSCDDGLYCTVADTCQQGVCTASDRNCSAQTGQCTLGECSEELQSCIATPTNQGQSCDDGYYCSVDDLCDQGSCSGTQRDCSDLDSACTLGECSEEQQQCWAEPAFQGEPCDDGLFCTAQDSCDQGVCGGQPRDCTELNTKCKVGYCDEEKSSCRLKAKQDGCLEETSGCGCASGAVSASDLPWLLPALAVCFLRTRRSCRRMTW